MAPRLSVPSFWSLSSELRLLRQSRSLLPFIAQCRGARKQKRSHNWEKAQVRATGDRHGQTQPSIKSLSRRVQLFGLIRLRWLRQTPNTLQRKLGNGLSACHIGNGTYCLYRKGESIRIISARIATLTSALRRKLLSFLCISKVHHSTRGRHSRGSGQETIWHWAAGRPTKDESERYEPVSIRLHSKVIEWAKEEAAEEG